MLSLEVLYLRQSKDCDYVYVIFVFLDMIDATWFSFLFTAFFIFTLRFKIAHSDWKCVCILYISKIICYNFVVDKLFPSHDLKAKIFWYTYINEDILYSFLFSTTPVKSLYTPHNRKISLSQCFKNKSSLNYTRDNDNENSLNSSRSNSYFSHMAKSPGLNCFQQNDSCSSTVG